MRSILTLMFGSVALFGAAGCTMSQQEITPPQAAHSQRGAADWRERMQENQDPDRSIEQQVHRLTRDLRLTPEQQKKVRQLSKEHNDRIQQILDAPPTATYEAFRAQVYAISQRYNDAVSALLTPDQIELMKAMVGRLDNVKEDRRSS